MCSSLFSLQLWLGRGWDVAGMWLGAWLGRGWTWLGRGWDVGETWLGM